MTDSRPITEAEVWAAERSHVAAQRGRQPIPMPWLLMAAAFLIGAAICWQALHA